MESPIIGEALPIRAKIFDSAYFDWFKVDCKDGEIRDLGESTDYVNPGLRGVVLFSPPRVPIRIDSYNSLNVSLFSNSRFFFSRFSFFLSSLMS